MLGQVEYERSYLITGPDFENKDKRTSSDLAAEMIARFIKTIA